MKRALSGAVPVLCNLILTAGAYAASEPAYRSDVVTSRTPGHAVEVEADIAGAKRLYLVVTDGGDGFACDWDDWA